MSQVFISRVIGLPLVDATDTQVGRIKDIICFARSDGRAPRVKGLVVELFARQRIFIPMVRVHHVTGNQVAIQGTIDTRRFERRDGELLVESDLFDRKFEHGGGNASVFDVAMHEVRSREWEISEVALQKTTRVGRFGFGGRTETQIVDWAAVPFLHADIQRTTATLVAEFADMNPADVAQELHDMDHEQRGEVLDALDDELLAEALEELPEEEQIEVISTLDTERAADILEEMDPDDAADLIRDLPDGVAQDLLAHMEPDEAKDLRRLLIYAEYTAGGMMTPEPVILDTDATVAQALAYVRREELTPALASMVFITRPPVETPTGRYIGAVHTQRLLREAPTLLAATMMDEHLEPLHPNDPLAKVSRFFATYNLVVAPVVNDAGVLVGAVTVDDVLDHMLPNDWRGHQMDLEAAKEREVNHG